MTATEAITRLESLHANHPPFAAVRQLTDDEVCAIADIEEFPFVKGKKARESLAKAIQRRHAKIAAAKAKWSDFYAWVDRQITPAGQWVHDLAHDGKLSFGDDYCTKSRVEAAARANPGLTLRRMPYGDTWGDDALAVFRGVPVPSEQLEEQPLNI